MVSLVDDGEPSSVIVPEWVNHIVVDDKNPAKVTVESKLGGDDELYSSSVVVPSMDHLKKPHRHVDSMNIIANTLNNLSMMEREQVYEEIHGVDKDFEETPEMVASKLSEMELQLQKIIKKPAYDQALQASSDYVQDDDLRLSFLRADYFNPSKAAKRFVFFFEKKLQLFGPACLGRPITQQDLNVDDQAALNAGHLQLLPTRDRAGRVVFCDLQNLFKPAKTGLNQIRAYIYMILSAVEDEETQKRGLVVILYHMGKINTNLDQDVMQEGSISDQWLPIRFSAIHECLDHPMMKVISKIIAMTTGPDFRARFRVHEGTHTECQYKLLTFGIPIDMFPITSQGELKRSSHKQFLARRRAKEKTLQEGQIKYDRFDCIEFPARTDILVGKGKPIQSHPGNVALRATIDGLIPTYMPLKKSEKQAMTFTALHDIQSKGGRFLKQDKEGWWIVVTEPEARRKVARSTYIISMVQHTTLILAIYRILLSHTRVCILLFSSV